ncbi:MAG: pectate lyase [Chloroflexi bacterium]|nr:pectate lyase [Chloroflexota bacterium]MCI0577767.1 pectate lyase [Chloroflexota bacterium]MCI0643427.1 pectate lyase [Chloroflexota bacterium]MCI0725914.1 pectate lyase [Chloroflexota bacterium]
MRIFRTIMIMICSVALAVAAISAMASEERDLGREILATNDGWASFATGTTGGSLADPSQVYTVTNRQELIAALNNGVYPPPSSSPSNTPKIIYVGGTIDANVDDNNEPLACEDYYRDDYTLEAFLAAYDPAVWGRDEAPSGPLEDARIASRNAQQDRVRIRVGSNTTIVGLDKQVTIRGAWLDIRGSSTANRTNIIIRNITFEDTYDCFPAWDPTDGDLGAWNALYDSISLRNSDHVWIDHNTFLDRETADSTLPDYFGVLYQVHDGLLDITNASDFVTVSWNRFVNHDKVMLIGSSDGASADRGKLRVTLHHNLFENLGQRAARVRFGQVHIYNNYYQIGNASNYVYSWGVGIESAIYAENNFFWVNPSTGITPDQFIERLNGTAIHESGTLLNAPSQSGHQAIDVLAAYNAVNDPDLSGAVGWAPTLFLEIEDTQDVLPAVQSGAGPFNWD